MSFQILTRKSKELILTDSYIPKSGMFGRYSFKKGKKIGGKEYTVQGPEFDNLITDTGLNSIGLTYPIAVLYVGTGTNVPATTDTTMGAFLNSTSTVQSNTTTGPTAPDYISTRTWTFRFAEGAAAGNLTEVGVGTSSAGVTRGVFSRALIVDSNGQPVTFTVLSDEFLDVTYSLSFKPDQNDYQSTVSLFDATGQSTTYTVTQRMCSIGTHVLFNNAAQEGIYSSTLYSGTGLILGATTASGLGNSQATTSTSNWAVSSYSPNSLKRTSTLSLGLNDANMAFGLGGLNVSVYSTSTFAYHYKQLLITPPIQKNNTMSLTFGYEFSWGRA